MAGHEDHDEGPDYGTPPGYPPYETPPKGWMNDEAYDTVDGLNQVRDLLARASRISQKVKDDLRATTASLEYRAQGLTTAQSRRAFEAVAEMHMMIDQAQAANLQANTVGQRLFKRAFVLDHPVNPRDLYPAYDENGHPILDADGNPVMIKRGCEC